MAVITLWKCRLDFRVSQFRFQDFHYVGASDICAVVLVVGCPHSTFFSCVCSFLGNWVFWDLNFWADVGNLKFIFEICLRLLVGGIVGIFEDLVRYGI